jgi:hypothetical protein
VQQLALGAKNRGKPTVIVCQNNNVVTVISWCRVRLSSVALSESRIIQGPAPQGVNDNYEEDAVVIFNVSDGGVCSLQKLKLSVFRG